MGLRFQREAVFGEATPMKSLEPNQTSNSSSNRGRSFSVSQLAHRNSSTRPGVANGETAGFQLNGGSDLEVSWSGCPDVSNNRDLERAIYLSLQNDDIVNDAEDAVHRQQQQSAIRESKVTVQQPVYVERQLPLRSLMPPVHNILDLPSLRSISQQVLQDVYENEKGEKIVWKDLLLPENHSKNREADDVDHLIQLVSEFPISSLANLGGGQAPAAGTERKQSWSQSTHSASHKLGAEAEAVAEQQQLVKDESNDWHAFSEVWDCAFGVKPLVTVSDLIGWWKSKFEFNKKSKMMKVGLIQQHGGPCGVLAALQCWIFLYSIILRFSSIQQRNHQNSSSENENDNETAVASVEEAEHASNGNNDNNSDDNDNDDANTSSTQFPLSLDSEIDDDEYYEDDIHTHHQHPHPHPHHNALPAPASHQSQRIDSHHRHHHNSNNNSNSNNHTRINLISKTLSNPILPLKQSNQHHEGWCPNYKRDRPCNRSSNSDYSSTQLHLLCPCECISTASLVWAICTILYRCTPCSQYRIAWLTFEPSDSLIVEEQAAFSAMGDSGTALAIKSIRDKMKYKVHQLSSISQVFAFYSKFNQELLFSYGSILSFVLSVIFTRGVNQVKSRDVDDPSVPLIGLFGHSSQELVNLLLCGRAVTNVFDGNRTISSTSEIHRDFSSSSFALTSPIDDEGVQLRGISRPQIVGYLTELEALHYCEVGSFYKYPLFPIWVVGRPNHFTSLFSLDPRVSRITTAEKLRQKFTRIFNKFDTANAGLIRSIYLADLLKESGLTVFSNVASNSLVKDGVVLRLDFVNWSIEMKTAASSGKQRHHEDQIDVCQRPDQVQQQETDGSSYLNPPSRFVLYHYNGQGGSRLIKLMVEQLDIPAVQEYDTTGLVPLLQTKWRNILVDELPLWSEHQI